jgi:hypothetical protein
MFEDDDEDLETTRSALSHMKRKSGAAMLGDALPAGKRITLTILIGGPEDDEESPEDDEFLEDDEELV